MVQPDSGSGRRPRDVHRLRNPGAHQLLSQERGAQVRDLRRGRGLPGCGEEPADLRGEYLRGTHGYAPGLPLQPRVVSIRRVHRGVDGAVGPTLLRTGVRLRRHDPTDGPRRPGADAGRCADVARTSRGAREVRPPRRRAPVLPDHGRDLGLPLCRTVLDVHRTCERRPVDRPGRTPRHDRVCSEPLLSVPVPRWRRAWIAVEPHRLQDQAVVGVQQLQDL